MIWLRKLITSDALARANEAFWIVLLFCNVVTGRWGRATFCVAMLIWLKRS